MDESLYTRIDHENGRVEFIPSNTPKKQEVDWEPEKEDWYYRVGTGGGVGILEYCGGILDAWHKGHFNIYPTQQLAEKASVLMKRSNAIIRACTLVDPDFEPDWNDVDQSKWTVYYSYKYDEWWSGRVVQINDGVAHVSTQEKANQVCELLTKWGVK